MMTDDDIRAEAKRREVLHANHASSTPYSYDYEYVGLKGECEFSAVTGLPMNLDRLPGGDGGKDFKIPLRMDDDQNREVRFFTLDVKTARKAYHLLVEVGKVVCDIYVLARYTDETGRVEFLGWEWREAVMAAPTGTFDYDKVSHYIPCGRLLPIDDLFQSYGFAKWELERAGLWDVPPMVLRSRT